MSSNPERSSFLPPYAAPAADHAESPRVIAAALSAPFVPPTWRPAADPASISAEAASFFDPEYEDAGASEPTTEPYASAAEGFSSDAGVASIEHVAATDDSALADDGFLAEDVSELPWIEAYAADEPVSTPEESPAESQPAADDAWAIADVSEHIARLAEELAAASKEPTTAPTPMPPAPAVSHTPWHDDDAWMDIMPALPNSGARDMAAETEWARAFGEPPAPMTPPALPSGDAQAAAASLESIARRLRSGELQVPGFVADRGDAAALAAALASLLGARE